MYNRWVHSCVLTCLTDFMNGAFCRSINFSTCEIKEKRKNFTFDISENDCHRNHLTTSGLNNSLQKATVAFDHCLLIAVVVVVRVRWHDHHTYLMATALCSRRTVWQMSIHLHICTIISCCTLRNHFLIFIHSSI